MSINCLLSVLDINYLTYSRKCVQYIFLVATDLFSSYEMSIIYDYVTNI